MASPLDRAFVEILPDFSKFVRAFKKDIDNATDTLETRFEQSFSRIERSASRSARSIVDKFTDAFDRLGMKAADAAGDVEDELDDIDAPAIDVDVDVDRKQVDDEIDRAVRGSRPPKIPIDIDLDREGVFSRFISSLTGIRLPIPGFIALGGAIGAAAASAIQFTAALAPAVGIIAGLPSVIGVGAALMTTLKVATLGVGEAFSVAATGSIEEFNAAMEGLAPNVQAAAGVIRELKPAFDELRNSVQQEFFAGFDVILQNLANTLLGPVNEGMSTVAASLNGLITGLATVATSSAGVDFVTQSFSILNTIIQNISEPLSMLFASLLSVGGAINEAFGATAGEGLASLITRFAEFLDQAAASGAAVAWINHAVDVFEQLGAIISPIVSIIGSIGDAARMTGGNILGAFGEALQVFADFLNTADGMNTLIEIFQTFNAIGSVFGDILAGIGPALPPLIGGIQSLVGAIAPLISAVAPLVGSLLTALAPLLEAIATAIQPLIPPIITLAEMIGGLLVTAINAVMPIVTTLLNLFSTIAVPILGLVATLFEAFAPILTTLLAALTPIFAALQPLFDLLAQIGNLLATILAPVFEVFGGILLWLVETIILPVLIPIIENLVSTLVDGLGTAVEWIGGQFELLGIGLEIVWNFIKDTIITRAKEMQQGFQNLVNVFKIGWDVLNNKVFAPIKAGINLVRDTVSAAISNIRSGWDSFVGFIKDIPGKISGALSSMFSPLADGFKSAINSVIRGWNNLSFSIPSVDIPGLGTVGGGTINTPNIPYLANGALATGPTLSMIGEGRFPEALLPLGDPRVTDLLATALGRASRQTGAESSSSNTMNSSDGMGDINVVVRIGERELTDIIVERIDESNRTMLRRARAGTRRNS